MEDGTIRKRVRGDDGLTDLQRLFVQEYLVDCNATQAAIRAGLGATYQSSAALASDCMSNPTVVAAIERGMAEKATRTKVDADRVLMGNVLLAESDIEDYLVDEEGNIAVRDGAHPQATRAITSKTFKITEKASGDRITEIKITLADKIGAWSNIMKLLGLGVTKVAPVTPDGQKPYDGAGDEKTVMERAQAVAQLLHEAMARSKMN